MTFVIDGGGWNVLQHWPDRWPNLKRLMVEGANYRNAITGSFPAVTACAHATIGTGTYPNQHGITGHNIRDGSKVRKAYGDAGHANPGDILIPTLADLWSDDTGNGAWVGEIGYQVWHMGMIGPRRPHPLARTSCPSACIGTKGRTNRTASASGRRTTPSCSGCRRRCPARRLRRAPAGLRVARVGCRPSTRGDVQTALLRAADRPVPGRSDRGDARLASRSGRAASPTCSTSTTRRRTTPGTSTT